ncbi:MAG TPA: FtsX-like permease family protein [Ramlibacter sp.]|uniref:ABC transporter permease n=1 Tax=Ramlibacter sp. TaxID=1917967 RepID=UPI002C43FE5F|nr:FtsX-like permease family protein [Ramlibacter sp.]HVZ44504.1 FtsX-like permease family protein [Ramlibacter sp.]
MTGISALAWRSAWNRRSTLSLVVFSIALSTLLLLGLERIRTDVRENFTESVSGTDLIVGARTGSIQLLLYAVFHIGSATNNIRMDSLRAIAGYPAVDWIVPLSLGDSHRGFPVMATSADYFTRFRYGNHRHLELARGRFFDGSLSGLYDTVIGQEVAEKLHYRLGDRIVLSHGSGSIPGAEHADKPFEVVGILGRTGTPVDRTVHISLEAMEAIHLDWTAGVPMPGHHISPEEARNADLTPKLVTAALVGLKTRAAVFSVQRAVDNYAGEPLMAILPGVALDELWRIVGAGERAMLAMSAIVAVVSLAGLISVVLAGLNERRRELAVLRSAGASPRQVMLLLSIEGLMITSLGICLGTLATFVAILVLGPWLQSLLGIALTWSAPTPSECLLLLAILVSGMAASLVPGWRAYRMSLADGLSPRL